MSIELSGPGVQKLDEAVRVLRGWPRDGVPMQLHPGDLGWNWRFGAEATAAAVRIWSRDGRMLAVGLLDSPEVLRLAIAPEAEHDDELARQLLADVTAPGRILPMGSVSVEARVGAAFRGLLFDAGWGAGETFTPLARDLAEPVADCGLRVEAVGPERAAVRAAVQRAAFDRSTSTDERWRAMAAGPAYADARCLVAWNDQDAVTVWSAGPGRPGLLEPLGVHRDHRGRGYGRAISVAAAAALREMGSSSAIVCTPSANAGAVATYRSAGFRQLPDEPDLCRNA